MTQNNYTPQLLKVLEDAQGIAAFLNVKHVCVDILFHSFLKNLNTASADILVNKCGIEVNKWISASFEVINKKRKSKKPSVSLSTEVVQIFAVASNLALTDFHLDYVGVEHLIAAFFNDPVPKVLRDFFQVSSGAELLANPVVASIIEAIVAFAIDARPIQQSQNSFDAHNEEEALSQFEKGEDFLEMFDDNPILSEFAINLNIEASRGKFDNIIDFDKKIAELATILCRKNKPNAILVGPAGVGKTSIVEGLAAQIVSGEAPELLSDKVIYSLNLSSMVAGTQFRGQFEKRLEDFINESKKYSNLILFIDEIHTLVGAGGTSNNSLEASNILKPELARGTISCIGATTINEYSVIKSDSALDRRFEKVLLKQPSRQQMSEVIPFLISRYQNFHSVEYSPEFIGSVIDYCDRFLPNKFYPDKAIDVIDHCGAQARVKHWQMDETSKGKTKEIITRMNEDDPTLSSDDVMAWQSSVDQWAANVSQIIPKVTVEDLAEFFQRKVNPLHSETNLQTFLNEIYCLSHNQKPALHDLKKSLRIDSLGLNTSHKAGRPFTYLFFGPNECGKTTLCENLVAAGEMINATTLHFSGVEFADYYDRYKILGDRNNNSLCGKIVLHPNSIVVIDDLEQMHGSCLDLLKQIFKEGRILMSNGETADFSNAVFFLTCGQISSKSMGFTAAENSDARPSISNLISENCDAKIALKPIAKKDLVRILHKRLVEVSKRLQGKALPISSNPWKLRSFVKKNCKTKGSYLKELDAAFQKFVVEAIYK